MNDLVKMKRLHEWVGHGIPFRATRNMYDHFLRECLPAVPPALVDRFSKYKTARDVEDDPPSLGPNPIGAEWDFRMPNMFFRDEGAEISWIVCPKTGKVAIDDWPCGRLVADGLPEFLARMHMENAIWWSLFEADLDRLCRSPDRADDPGKDWDVISTVLSVDQLEYLRPYRDDAIRDARDRLFPLEGAEETI